MKSIHIYSKFIPQLFCSNQDGWYGISDIRLCRERFSSFDVEIIIRIVRMNSRMKHLTRKLNLS